jgi:hypothetical protein
MHNWQNFWGETPDPDRKASAALPIPLLWAGLSESTHLIVYLFAGPMYFTFRRPCIVPIVFCCAIVIGSPN